MPQPHMFPAHVPAGSLSRGGGSSHVDVWLGDGLGRLGDNAQMFKSWLAADVGEDET